MIRVIGIGDNVCDKYVRQKKMYPGGQALNFAVYSRMLGAQAAYLGVFGTDGVAEHVMRALDEHQVDRSRCRQYAGENGCARVSLVNGDRIFLGSNQGGVLKTHPLALSREDLNYAAGFHLAHTSNNSYMDTQLPRLKTCGVSISYDFSGQWTDVQRVARVAPYTDYAFLSCGSLTPAQTRTLCRNVHKKGAGMVVATRGSQGAVIFDGISFYDQAPKPVEAIDTLGAGDSFAAAFLLSLTEWRLANEIRVAGDRESFSRAVSRAAERAAEFSAKTCMEYGAFGHGRPYAEEEADKR